MEEETSMNAENTMTQKEPKRSFLDKLRSNNILSIVIHDYAMFIALLLIAVFCQWRTDGVLLAPMNISKLVMQNSYILI